MPVSSIALQRARNSHSWPTQSLKPAGLPPDRRRISAMNCIISTGVEKAEWLAGETQSCTVGTPRVWEISTLTLAGLGALAELQLDHLDLLVGRCFGEFVGAESAVRIAAAEIARADLPDDVAAPLAVIGAEAAFAGVVREAAELGAAVQRPAGIGRQRTE